MSLLNRLESVVDSATVALLMVPVAINLANIVDYISNPPVNAYYSKCVYDTNDLRQKSLCEWVDRVVDYYDKICNNCMKRKGSYPIVIQWSDQSKKDTLGNAFAGKFKCKIELAINEDWIYDGGMKFRTTVLHEIGHCYGLKHDKDPESIMYPNHNPSFTEDHVLKFVKQLQTIAAK